MTVIRDDNNVPELLRRMEMISNKGIQVGILGDADGELLLYASVHEFGAPSINVPERSFIRSTFDDKESEIEKVVEDMLVSYVEGDIDFDSCMDAIGEYLVGLIQTTIRDMASPPLLQATIDAKGSSGVLVDSGLMLDSIDYKVVDM